MRAAPHCLAARTAVIALRGRSERNVEPRRYRIVFPIGWSKSQLLAYCRAVHLDETVRLVEWHDLRSDREPRTWLANQAAFSDFKHGTMKRKS